MGKVILVCLILLGILLLLAYIEDKLQDNAKPSGQIQSVPLKDVNLYIDYELYADALIACVNSNCEILGLRQPKDRPYHYAPPQERIHRSCRNLFYSYLFEREFDISSGNGMKKIKNPTYIRIDNQTIYNTLSASFPNYCYDRNLPPCQIYAVSDLGTSRIIVSIVGEC